ncbi:autotransporter strand-loop-strand O-heptosyltransferase [Selenomonas ruminis]|uniref:Autotransporter strand-loop-strand O-heptosyltransferase n=1 Tax=Selenomonas ruminis TaxID=2593411 RepID=A0A5D6W6P6_9FIRM|nr:autotransporter strand-loop-strand O-heptosyltransferase [Selenomonas sp. mPRGC5]TYZ24141.1 autotransporter strand-loop-strand O-heptosyltransferase [Selenomonas sp. mPRGC5]
MLSYPIQYFSCTPATKLNNDHAFQEYVGFFAKIDALFGEVRGETGIKDLKIDFNNGLRLQVPAGDWYVRMSNAESGQVFFSGEVSEQILESKEKYIIPWHIEVYYAGEKVFEHFFDPTEQKVFFLCCSKGLGDTLAFLPYIRYYQEIYQADVSYYVPDYMRGLCARLFPDLEYQESIMADTYAVVFANASLAAPDWMPVDGRSVPMEDGGKYLLNLPVKAPALTWTPRKSLIAEPYVCIGVQASGAIKGWLYPGGWDVVVAALKAAGYRVLCIDREKRQEQAGYVTEIPAGAENFTGNIPLEERADMLAQAEFFIGLSSGLSWLANLVGCPVVLIGGFTQDWFEFPNQYRVRNRMACGGCFNDAHVLFTQQLCPYQGLGNDRSMECSRLISPQMVFKAIERLLQDKAANAKIEE